MGANSHLPAPELAPLRAPRAPTTSLPTLSFPSPCRPPSGVPAPPPHATDLPRHLSRSLHAALLLTKAGAGADELPSRRRRFPNRTPARGPRGHRPDGRRPVQWAGGRGCHGVGAPDGPAGDGRTARAASGAWAPADTASAFPCGSSFGVGHDHDGLGELPTASLAACPRHPATRLEGPARKTVTRRGWGERGRVGERHPQAGNTQLLRLPPSSASWN